MLSFNRLPNGKPISIVGFGCSSIWAKAAFPEARAAEILRAAHHEGINHFDTAPSYGLGTAERRLGRFIADQKRDDLVLSTKVGTVVVGGGKLAKDFSPRGMEDSLSQSLRTLGLEQVDILYLHGPTLAQLNDDVYEFFAREKRRGRIVLSGINSFQPAIIRAFVETPIDAVMLQYNVADLSCVDILPQLQARGKIVIAGTVLAQGITRLSNFLPTSAARLWYLARALKNDPFFIPRGRRIARILAGFGLTESSDALRLVTSDDRVLSSLFGTSLAAHVVQNAQAARKPLVAETRDSLLANLRR